MKRLVISKSANDLYFKLLEKSRSKSNLIPRYITVIRNGKTFTQKVWVRPEDIKKPINRFSGNDIDDYDNKLKPLLNELENFDFSNKSENEVFDEIAKMGYVNSKAFKGTGRSDFLNDIEVEINNKIYKTKDSFNEKAVNYFINNKLDVKYDNFSDIIYFRNSNTGVQISFHGYKNNNNLPIEKAEWNEWDGVFNSYKYNAQNVKEYEKQKNRAKGAELFYETIKKAYKKTLADYFIQQNKDKINKDRKLTNLLKKINTDNNTNFTKADIKLDIIMNISDNASMLANQDEIINNINKAQFKNAINIKLPRSLSYKQKNELENYIKNKYVETMEISPDMLKQSIIENM